ncbi:MAG TPA: hypothetical protein DIT04_04240 [Dysgonomonas sp.]|nr:hypothetical protein [Dysgonomonas sp.]
MRKNIIFSILIGILSFASVSTLMAQPKPHPRHGHGPGGNSQLNQVATYSGSVTEWAFNDDFVYDGLYLKTGETTLFVKFPPHLGQQIRSLGNNISVNGVLRYTPEGRQELKMVSVTAKGQTVYDQKPSPRALPQQESFITGNAKVKQMQINKRGEACGYILDNGVVLRIPPHIALQLSQMVQVGSTIGYTGIEKELKDGQVQAQNYKIVRSQTISVNGTQYMVK